MSTQSASNRVDIVTTQSNSYERFGGLCAILSGIFGFLYSISFVLLKNDLLIALFLMLGGVCSTAVLVAVYDRLKETDANFALWALFLSTAGAFGAIISDNSSPKNTSLKRIRCGLMRTNSSRCHISLSVNEMS